jgi:hypothetical protein
MEAAAEGKGRGVARMFTNVHTDGVRKSGACWKFHEGKLTKLTVPRGFAAKAAEPESVTNFKGLEWGEISRGRIRQDKSRAPPCRKVNSAALHASFMPLT